MSLTPTIYSSTDSGAPVLTGQAGTLLTLLRALLVNGYASKLGLGWTEEYSGTNKAVFRNNPVSGKGYFTRVDDANAYYTLMRSYLTMSDVDTGDANPVPTAAQWPNGMAWIKSRASGSTARPWWAIGNERSFYLFVDVNSDGNDSPNFMGDIDTLLAGDMHNFFLSSSGLDTYAGAAGTAYPIAVVLRAAVASWSATMSSTIQTVAGYLARRLDQSVGAVACDHPATEYGASGALGGAGVTYPFAGRLLHQRAAVREAANTIRGTMPGLVVPLHNRPLSNLGTISNVPGTPAGSTLVAKNFKNLISGSLDGQVLFVTGADW